MLASQLGGYGARLGGYGALPHASLGASPNLATFPGICWMCSTGSPLQQRILYRIISLIWRSLLGLAPAYLRDLCHTTMGIPGRRSLRSTEQGFLLVPFALTAIMQNRAFSVVGPSLWNGLSLALRLFPRIVSNSFYAHLKLSFLAILESGALMSSRLQGAL